MSSPEQWTHPEPGVGPAATAAKPTAEQVIAGLRATSEGGPELVQLLTPEGERVANPEWDPYVADVTAEDLRESLPRHGPHQARRPGGQRAAAPGPARHLGAAARPGGRADRLRQSD